MKLAVKLPILAQGLFVLACLMTELALATEAAPIKPPTKPFFTVPEPPVLTEQAQRILTEVNLRIPHIDTAGLEAQLKTRPETVVIDVRTPAELAALGGHIEAARFFNISRGWLEFQVESFVSNKNTPIVVYCGVSQRSPLAADTLIKLGYTNVKNYSDGFFKWRAPGLPVRSLDKAPTSFLFNIPP